MKRFKNILYVADSSGVALKAFHHAVGLAERNNAPLAVVIVMERIPPYLTRLTPHMLRQVRIKELHAALDRLREWVAGRVEVEAKIIEGKPFLEVIRDVLRNDRDLVVKSVDHDNDAMDWLFGSTDMHLLRKCPCPVWLVKSTEPTPVRRVMACVDFNDFDPSGEDRAEPLNRMILEMAGSLALLERSEFHVVHACEAIGEPLRSIRLTGINDEVVDSYVNEVRLEHCHWLDRLLRKTRSRIGPEAYDDVERKIHMPIGRASEVIPALARELNIDLIVMGTVARTGIPGLIIGNTAETVLNQIRCSVLAVKPPGFVTPVALEECYGNEGSRETKKLDFRSWTSVVQQVFTQKVRRVQRLAQGPDRQ
jgi:nucleotide-binding universal stress UspA family protein